jgi:hypothetical protein
MVIFPRLKDGLYIAQNKLRQTHGRNADKAGKNIVSAIFSAELIIMYF